jgi:hypothetical protein
MIANVLNTLVGLWLTYAAIFPQSIGAGGNRMVLGAAALTIVLSLWARRSDISPWQSSTAITAGAILAVMTIVDQIAHLSGVLMFWTVLWAGLVSATVSLWAALYRPTASASPAE